MAHRTNVIQVPIEFPKDAGDKEQDVIIKDLTCGKEMPKKDSRHVLFRAGEPLFFCSKACRDKFLSSGISEKARRYA